MSSASRVGAFFDLDGLILDSEPLQLLATNRALETLGLRIMEGSWREYVGSPTKANLERVVRAAGTSADLAELERLKDQAYAEICDERLSVRRGVEQLIRELEEDGFALAVVTSSVLADAERLLERVGLRGHFDTIVAGDAVDRGKPAPDPYLAACQTTGFAASQCVALEDSRNGVLSAVAAGVMCVAVPNAFTRDQDLSAADLIVDDFAELDAGKLRALASGDGGCGRSR